MINCEIFKGGYCAKVDMHVPRNYCLNMCKYFDKMPTLTQQAKSLAKAVVTQVKAGRPIRSEDEIKRIKKICKECDFYNNKNNSPRCQKCGCYLNIKQRWATADCPIGKWKEKPVIFTNAEGKPLGLENFYKGKSVFFVLNGPSLNDLDWSLLKQPGIITFGVNNGAVKFRPNLVSLQDGPNKFHKSIWQDPSITKFTNISNKDKYYWDGYSNGIKVSTSPSVVYHKRKSSIDENWFYKDAINWGIREKDRTSFLGMIHIAYLLGFRKIYLVGCDFKMEEGKPYCFDEHKGKSGVKSNNSMYGKLNKFMKWASPLFEKHKLEIYNCTKDSGLIECEYKPLKEALNETKLDISGEHGLYQTKQPPKIKVQAVPRKDETQEFVIVGYYTKGYTDTAMEMIDNLTKMNIKHDICSVDDLGNWDKNTKFKPIFIKSMLEKHNKPVVYLDVDARIYRFPEIFNTINEDIGIHWIKRKSGRKEFLSGTVYFNNTLGARKLLDKWEEDCLVPNEQNDQNILGNIIATEDIGFYELPMEYCMVYNHPSHRKCKDPLIVHYQASRRLKYKRV